MYRSTMVAIISFWSVCAVAADWKLVADTKLGQLKLDKSSVTRDGKYTVAVLAYEFKEQQRLSAPPKNLFNKRQDDVLVDCSEPSLGIRKSLFFDADKLVDTYALDLDKVKFNAPAPETMALTVFESVCAVAAKARP